MALKNCYRLLGNSGLRVSQLCLGGMSFGQQWGQFVGVEVAKAESEKILDLFEQEGGNFIDTANAYQWGESEEIIGDWMQKRGNRHKMVLATKYTNRPIPEVSVNVSGNQRKSLFHSVDLSLKRLKSSYIDVLYVHFWDYSTPVEEVMRGLDDLVRAGKVHYLAVSDTPAWVVAQANTLAREKGWTPFVAYQGLYSVLERDMERDIIPMCKSLGLASVPWGVLGGGKLSGRHVQGGAGVAPPSKDGKPQSRPVKLTERELLIATEVAAVAKEIDRSSAQVALNWAISRGVESPIVGVRTADQLKDLLKTLEFRLSPAHMERLNKVGKPALGFPHSLIGQSTQESPYLFFGDNTIRILPRSAI